MPLTINVGVSRKASHNYQSRGVSLNMTAELDQALLSRPAELQEQISQLYLQAEHALRRQMNGGQAGSPAPGFACGLAEADRGLTSIAEASNGSHAAAADAQRGHNAKPRAPATRAQRRAIENIAAQLGLDVTDECHRVVKCAPDALTIRTASHMIDYLRARGRNEAEA